MGNAEQSKQIVTHRFAQGRDRQAWETVAHVRICRERWLHLTIPSIGRQQGHFSPFPYCIWLRQYLVYLLHGKRPDVEHQGNIIRRERSLFWPFGVQADLLVKQVPQFL